MDIIECRFRSLLWSQHHGVCSDYANACVKYSDQSVLTAAVSPSGDWLIIKTHQSCIIIDNIVKYIITRDNSEYGCAQIYRALLIPGYVGSTSHHASRAIIAVLLTNPRETWILRAQICKISFYCKYTKNDNQFDTLCFTVCKVYELYLFLTVKICTHLYK